MSNLSPKISHAIDTFVGDLSALVRSRTLHVVESALRSVELRARSRRVTSSSTKTSAHSEGSSSRETHRPKQRTEGKRRSSEQLEELAQAFLLEIRQHPGLQIGALSENLKVSPKDLALTARRLLDEKKVKTEGRNRWTRYYLGESDTPEPRSDVYAA